MPSFERNQLGIALVPEGRHVFPYLTVMENLEMGGYKFRNDRAKFNSLIEKMVTMFPKLKSRAKQNAGTLSGGEQQMLVIGRALMSEPRLLCMDEPSLGLAPIIVQDIFKTIRQINAEGTTVLLVEQNARYALSTAARAYVLQTGQILMSGPSSDLINNSKIKEAYLGS
jgi:branched-chain amino acid transport system ATP-binding protein